LPERELELQGVGDRVDVEVRAHPAVDGALRVVDALRRRQRRNYHRAEEERELLRPHGAAAVRLAAFEQ
jgi:hypothetical protein